MPSTTVATLENLTVRYGRKVAIENLTVTFPGGAVGLLGPNGAGKSTLLKTMMGFLTPSSGVGTVLGINVTKQGIDVRRKIGLMPEMDCYVPGMSAVTFVTLSGELAGMPPANALSRAHEVLDYCSLGEARYRNVETYSTGMKQRVKLAQALVHGPELLFLDEPTNGLDPAGRDEMLTLIQDISHGKDTNVIVSSHLLPDIERICDSVILMQKGRVVQQGTIADLRATGGLQFDIELRFAEDSAAFLTALAGHDVEVRSQMGTRLTIAFMTPPAAPGELLFHAAKSAGVQLRGFRNTLRSLEDIFLEAVA